jgi:hypothetical protein
MQLVDCDGVSCLEVLVAEGLVVEFVDEGPFFKVEGGLDLIECDVGAFN